MDQDEKERIYQENVAKGIDLIEECFTINAIAPRAGMSAMLSVVAMQFAHSGYSYSHMVKSIIGTLKQSRKYFPKEESVKDD